MVNAWWSDRYGRRGLCAILMSLLAMVGYISTPLSPLRRGFGIDIFSFPVFYMTKAIAPRYVALFLAITGVYSTSPALVTWRTLLSPSLFLVSSPTNLRNALQFPTTLPRTTRRRQALP